MLNGANRNALVNTAFQTVKPFLRLACINVSTYIQTNKYSKYYFLGFYCVYRALL